MEIGLVWRVNGLQACKGKTIIWVYDNKLGLFLFFLNLWHILEASRWQTTDGNEDHPPVTVLNVRGFTVGKQVRTLMSFITRYT